MDEPFLELNWQFVADTVMGGVSEGHVAVGPYRGRPAVRLSGTVSTANNGGFIQAAAALDPNGDLFDASAWTGLAMDVTGNGATYNLHLRTADLTRPWQSYRASFDTSDTWQTVEFPFAAFTAYRTEWPLDVTRLRRVGVLGIGRDFTADVGFSGLRLYL